MYSCVVVNAKGEVRIFQLTNTNIRKLRERPANHMKASAIFLVSDIFSKNKKDFHKETAAFANEWVKKYKENVSGKPNLNEMVEGLLGWYVK